ncbi:hypothetical protein Lal_00007502 [Lupinus albus]|nr:hypothetical protein Lal_00007502 [Lupinus albus]
MGGFLTHHHVVIVIDIFLLSTHQGHTCLTPIVLVLMIIILHRSCNRHAVKSLPATLAQQSAILVLSFVLKQVPTVRARGPESRISGEHVPGLLDAREGFVGGWEFRCRGGVKEESKLLELPSDEVAIVGGVFAAEHKDGVVVGRRSTADRTLAMAMILSREAEMLGSGLGIGVAKSQQVEKRR